MLIERFCQIFLQMIVNVFACKPLLGKIKMMTRAMQVKVKVEMDKINLFVCLFVLLIQRHSIRTISNR